MHPFHGIPFHILSRGYHIPYGCILPTVKALHRAVQASYARHAGVFPYILYLFQGEAHKGRRLPV